MRDLIATSNSPERKTIRDKLRAKLLKIAPRIMLEGALDSQSRPYHMTRTELENTVLSKAWDDIELELFHYIERAKD